MIELINFSKQYHSFFSKKINFTVKEINAVFENGKVSGLLGPNGSGKTTILKAICGFHYPTKGKILVSDWNGDKVDIGENPGKAMELIGYVPEKSILPPQMYVYEFLEYVCSVHKLTNCEKLIKETAEECSISKVLGKRIKTLSKGFQQRVSFAQAIIHNPPNLILDEPITGLDPAQIIQMRSLISKMAEKKAVLLSTHILQEVTSLCSNLLVINNGAMKAFGNEEEILKTAEADNLEQAFLNLTKSGEYEC